MEWVLRNAREMRSKAVSTTLPEAQMFSLRIRGNLGETDAERKNSGTDQLGHAATSLSNRIKPMMRGERSLKEDLDKLIENQDTLVYNFGFIDNLSYRRNRDQHREHNKLIRRSI